MPNNTSKKSTQRYNIYRTAEKVGVHERSIRYWIKKGWVTPKRDYRNYPVFTDSDIEKIKEWRNNLR